MIIDISWPLTPDMAVYPNNTPFRRRPLSTGHSNVSEIMLGTHTGTHVDAPCHVAAGQPTLDEIPLDCFVGPCRVIDCTRSIVSVTADDLMPADIQPGERIILKTTNSDLSNDEFVDDYIWLAPDAAEYLAILPVKMVGIDYLSVKQRGNSDNRPHTWLLERGIPIVEGLRLAHVEPGPYDLTVLPLSIPGADGSPARAILQTDAKVNKRLI